MAYHWVATELRTGALICDLPGLVVSEIEHRLCDYASVTGMLPVVGAPVEWERATAPMASALVLLDDDTPIWGGIPLKRTRTGADTIALSLATVEAYLGRRFVGDVRYAQVEQCTMAADLISRFVLDGTIAMEVEATPGTTLRDRTYTSESDKSVLSALSELSAVIAGPEFTVRWIAGDAGSMVTYRPVVSIADRIGTPTGTLAPAAVFDMPGVLTSVELVEDWAEGSGANRVIATSSASEQDQARPESAPQVYDDPDRPTVEYRWTPSSSITQVSTLTDHARAALEVMRSGAQPLALTARVDRYPVLGEHWGIGDDIGYHIDPTVPAFPRGLSGVARCIGWKLSLSAEVPTVTPILADVSPFITVEEVT